MQYKLVISTSRFQSQVADLLPCNKYKKSQLTYSLLVSYGLLDGFDVIIDDPCCNKKDLLQFHSRDYIDLLLDPVYNRIIQYDDDESKWSQLHPYIRDWLDSHPEEVPTSGMIEKRAGLLEFYKKYNRFKKKRSISEAFSESESESESGSGSGSEANEYFQINNSRERQQDVYKKFNLEGDCPLFSFLPLYCEVISGASLMLSDFIEKSSSQRTIAINWDGGRHHAIKNKASGFCYINDIVILIQKLRKKGISKVSYIDFDLHHGDGVEKAFRYSSNIQTISMHMYEPGFFPCTGSLEDTLNGKNIVNVPLYHGVDDNYMTEIVNELIKPLIERHSPEVLVIQCGGDGLIGDKFEEWQLTISGLTRNIQNLIEWFPKSDIILLGGGGYNELVMSRFYTYLTYQIVKKYGSKPIIDLCIPRRTITNASDKEEFNSDREDEDEDGDGDGDVLLPEHEFIELYSKEFYKFWVYELESSNKRKTLKNYNDARYLDKLLKFYGMSKPKTDNCSSEINFRGKREE
ncbi:hypothetical protein Kpol_376p15 [Vanderwaltozyma polyspora DSM 70294]|uniref:histone deacetylase n=1 Tax=Vanderwaltozyma polyspora (strain ATCC 22028 / DSM 70294 / BCRC 21397 / CBS 2163 / NBRC 10782 / NRRL Y-8283 / UCD 57-17) TaxID=436907 RepID=A7TRW5_VANPO|nr:uncharacterized protein Kpol_376p15 [Vanderwaltozyma polyspora DSM 70294]EDO15002.1 hypothetical protein Kpol_376p15 [Vanderwaltozyma polyspora DSM 70294]